MSGAFRQLVGALTHRSAGGKASVVTPRKADPNAPGLLPEQRVGAALRAARESSGIAMREMARRLNYRSHSSLSEYENGAKMPSESVVQGYEHVLGLERNTLMAVLEAANVERHGDVWSKRKVHVPVQFVSDEPPPPAVTPSEQPAIIAESAPMHHRRRS